MDAQCQIIVSQHVTPATGDVNQLERAVSSIQRTLRRKPRAVLADAGYWSESNAQAMERKKIAPFIATRRFERGEVLVPAPRGRPPDNLSARQKMERKLATLRGKKTYAKRKQIVEPVFGQIKQARGFRQFLRRGLTAVGRNGLWSVSGTTF